MLRDAFLPNLLIFAVGMVAAWGYLRTGRTLRGTLLLVGLWVLADIALLARFAYQGGEDLFFLALCAMQAYALSEFLLFTYGRIARRGARHRQLRESLFRVAIVHFLRDELEQAQAVYRRLVRRDPWDLDAAVHLATVLARRGRSRAARAWFRSARSLDREGRYAELLQEELRRFAARRVVRGA